MFTVDNVKSTQPVTYSLADEKGEKIQGTFYEQEVYVKWKGNNNSFNSWIPLTDLQDGS